MNAALNIRLNNKIIEIENVLIDLLSKKVIRFPNIGLAGGLSGIALFFFYRYKQTDDERNIDIAGSIMDDLLSNNLDYHMSTLCGGLGGMGWLIEHSVKNEFVEGDTNDILSIVDERLLRTVNVFLNDKFYDFLHGAVGIGYYFLNRSPFENKNKILSFIVNGLNNFVIRSNDFAMWEDYDHKEKKIISGKFNLGLSHGIPSIMVFLAKVAHYGVEKRLAYDLAEKAGNFILSCEINRTNNSLSKYPYNFDENGGQMNTSNSRLAWCYGDLGVALSLWITGKHLSINKFKSKAIEIIDSSINRIDLTSNLVFDAGICHGSAGISHIYRRFYWETNNELYLEKADFWMEVTLDLLYHKDGYAGYKAYKPDEETNVKRFENSFGILEGVAGVGLTMISALLEDPTSWDEWLMIS